MTLPQRPIALEEDGSLVALDKSAFDRLSDFEASQGVSTPGLLQAVYLSGANTVDVADSTLSKSPCVGFVSALLPGSKCLVRKEGELDGFVGLTPGDVYYLDPATPGGITNTFPLPPYAPGVVQQEIGTAVSATVLLITIDADFIEM